jgi:hypothetical protein
MSELEEEGRPAGKPVLVVLSLEDHRELRIAAAEAEMPMSRYVREVVKKALVDRKNFQKSS